MRKPTSRRRPGHEQPLLIRRQSALVSLRCQPFLQPLPQIRRIVAFLVEKTQLLGTLLAGPQIPVDLIAVTQLVTQSRIDIGSAGNCRARVSRLAPCKYASTLESKDTRVPATRIVPAGADPVTFQPDLQPMHPLERLQVDLPALANSTSGSKMPNNLSASLRAALESLESGTVTTGGLVQALSCHGAAKAFLDQSSPLDVPQTPEAGGEYLWLLGRSMGPNPVSSSVHEVVNASLQIANDVFSMSLDTHHVLLALARHDGPVGQLLRDQVDVEELERRIAEVGDVDFESEQWSRCRRCGFESPVPAVFKHELGTCCLPCHEIFTARLTLMRVVTVYGMTGILLLALADVQPGPWLALNFALVIVFRGMMSLVHELGHLVAAILLGHDIAAIEIGQGRVVWSHEPFVFRSLPLGGRAHAFASSAKAYKLKQTIFLLAGPLANLLVAGGLWIALGSTAISSELAAAGSRGVPLLCLLFAAAGGALENLLPLRADTMPSDALATWWVWIKPVPPAVHFEPGQRAMTMSTGLGQAGVPDWSRSRLARLLAANPEDPTIRTLSALPAASLADVDALLEDPQVRERFGHLLSIVKVWCDPERPLDEARASVEAVISQKPRFAFALATRGAIDILQGSVERGVRALRVCVRDGAMVSLAPLVAYLAVGEEQLGNDRRARACARTSELLGGGQEALSSVREGLRRESERPREGPEDPQH